MIEERKVARRVNELLCHNHSVSEAEAGAIYIQACREAGMVSLEDVRKLVWAQIDQFQDIFSRPKEESSNAFVCEIRNRVDEALARISPKPEPRPTSAAPQHDATRLPLQGDLRRTNESAISAMWRYLLGRAANWRYEVSEHKLLPCPFCGREGGLDQDGSEYWCICTSKCVTEEDNCSIRPTTVIFDAPEDAIAAWNRRNIKMHIHGDEAYWCENCQCVIDSPKQCSSCGTLIGIEPLHTFVPIHMKERKEDNEQPRPSQT